MNVTQTLTKARQDAGLTQAELARRAGTSQSAISAYEAGRKAPSTSTLERLLAACGQRATLTLNSRTIADLSGPVGRQLHSNSREVRAVLKRHGALRPRVFGSVARGEDTETSDLDLVVDMPPGSSLSDVAALMLDLRELLGRNVDVLTTGALDSAMQETTDADGVPL